MGKKSKAGKPKKLNMPMKQKGPMMSGQDNMQTMMKGKGKSAGKKGK